MATDCTTTHDSSITTILSCCHQANQSLHLHCRCRRFCRLVAIVTPPAATAAITIATKSSMHHHRCCYHRRTVVAIDAV